MAKKIKKQEEVLSTVAETLPIAEALAETPVVEEPEVVVPNVQEVAPEEPKVVEQPKVPEIVQQPVAQTEKTFRERILDYIDGQPSGEIRINMFLKSLFPVPTFQQPAKWLDTGENKQLRDLLEKMSSDGEIIILNDSHRQLGKNYYVGDAQLRKNHTIDTVQIVVKKCNN